MSRRNVTQKSLGALISVPAFILILLLSTGTAALAATGNQNLSISAQSQTGAALTGYYIQVSNSLGQVVQTGFSPGVFALSTGSYTVSVGDYGGEYFSHWNDSVTTRVHHVTIASSPVSLTASYTTTPGGLGTGSSIIVQSQYTNGAALTGMYVVLAQSGTTAATDFTPAGFSTTSGQTYTVTVYDYTGAYFNHWSTGATTRTLSVTATSSQATLTAVYCTTKTGCGSSGPTIVVGAQYSNGTALAGMYTELQLNGNIVATGFTPVSFAVTNGQSYTVTVSNYEGLFFNEWTNGYSVRTMPVTANSSTTTETAVFTTTQQAPPPTGYSITVNSNLFNGTAVNGFYVDVRVNGNHIASGFTPVTIPSLEPGVQYQVVVYWFGNYYFREFSNGDLNRYGLVTFNSTGPTSVTLDALYQYVPASQAADLNVVAELPNGTVIGSTFNNTTYIQHTPGLWLTIAPGSGAPFTGSFTGGSILPFVLFNNAPYTIAMSAGYQNYQFAYWKDTGSTNAVRTITLAGSATYIAVYTLT